jgi:hypothetical protein
MPDRHRAYDAETQRPSSRQITFNEPATQFSMNTQVPHRARRSARRGGTTKWLLGCAGVGMLLCMGALMLLVIVLPIGYRSLEPRYRDVLKQTAPFLSNFDPTMPPAFLPTNAATNADAMALLATPIGELSTPTAAPNTGGLAASGGSGGGESPTPQPTTPIPSGTSVEIIPPTVQPTVQPTNPPTTLVPTTVEPSPTPQIVTATKQQSNVVGAATNTLPVMVPTQTRTPTDVPTATASFTPTIAPTSTDAPTLTATTPPSPTAIPIPVSYHAEGYKVIHQTWNNCGPANLAQVLSSFGWAGKMEQIAGDIKPHPEDKNVSPWQLVQYVNNNTSDLKAIMRVGGDLTMLKRLTSQGFGVIVETGFFIAGEGWMGHYLTLLGYDDNQRAFFGLDTYLGAGPDNLGIREKYDVFDKYWQQFNRVYVVIFPKEREGALAALLGPHADLAYNAQHALNIARKEASAQPNNQYAWFNVGSNFTLLGQYKEATLAFDQALSVGGGLPFRFLWYQFTIFEAYYNIGNFAQVLALINSTLQTTVYVEELYYWRGMVSAARGKPAPAIEDFKKALRFNPGFAPATDRIAEVQNGNFRPPALDSGGR